MSVDQPTAAQAIGRQPALPLSAAWEVVAQGIRIRLGRSLVTLSSVALGIAFLASILVGQQIQRGVQAETDARDLVVRQMALVQAELGNLSGKHLTTVGTPAVADQRLLAALAAAGMTLSPINADAKPAAGTLVLALGGAPIPDGLKAVGLSAGDEATQAATRAAKASQARARALWITGIALAVTTIGIANAMLMSVTERFREIGTMKCLGALSSFIRRVFLLEACLIGGFGGVAGAVLGLLASGLNYGVRYGLQAVAGGTAWGEVALLLVGAVIASVVLSMAAALYPAWVAARMLPAHALRSSV